MTDEKLRYDWACLDSCEPLEGVVYESLGNDETRVVAAFSAGDAGCMKAEALANLLNSLEQDALRWRALIGCARIRVVGSAGFGYPAQHGKESYTGRDPDPTGYRHVGIEIWTRYAPPSDDSEKLLEFQRMIAGERQGAVDRLEQFTELARSMVEDATLASGSSPG